MNCRTAQDRLLADRDAPPDPAADDALAQHVAGCPDCAALQRRLTAARDAWQETADRVTIPDPQTEWHAVRRRIRQSPAQPAWVAAWPRILRWAAPLTAAAAIALVIWTGRDPTDATAVDPVGATASSTLAETGAPDAWAAEFEDHFTFVAHAEFVETENEDASPFVYVDDESGWLIVWASDPPDGASI